MPLDNSDSRTPAEKPEFAQRKTKSDVKLGEKRKRENILKSLRLAQSKEETVEGVGVRMGIRILLKQNTFFGNLSIL